MLLKTEGIVLRTLKHQDDNLITTVYTREFGLRSFILKAYRSRRSSSKHSYFQPLSIVDLVFIHKENRSLHTVTESRIATLLPEIQTDPVKLSIGLAMLEIFYDTVKEEEANLALYDFMQKMLLCVDQAPRRMIHFFIFFLLHLTRYLGFFPLDESAGSAQVKFDIRSGTITKATQQADPIALLIRRFAQSQLRDCQEITFDSREKKFLIKTLFEYYEHHIDGFRYPQTLRVFSEVFGE